VRPLIPTLPEERFESSMELEWPIEGLEPLSFVLTRLLEPLSTRLERRDRGAAVLHVMLRLVTKDTHTSRLELPSPMRDVRTLRTLALLDLESRPPAAAIDRVAIVIDPTPGRVLQHTLFTRAHPTPEQISTLLARLGALMGQDRLGAPEAVDSYRPGAFAMAAFATCHDVNRKDRKDRKDIHNGLDTNLRRPVLDTREGYGPSASASGGGAPREIKKDVVSALRRCRHPVPARVVVDDGRPVRVTTDRRGFAGGTVLKCSGPWRTSGNWWAGGERLRPCRAEAKRSRGEASASARAGGGAPAPLEKSWAGGAGEAPWDRDEWDVAVSDGAVYRIFQNRDTDAWFIEAIVD
jgi:protein ImuB